MKTIGRFAYSIGGSTLAAMLLSSASLGAAEPFPTTCLSPDNDDPEVVLRYVLDRPTDGSRRDMANCIVQRGSAYPPIPRPDPRRPNVMRSYRILSNTQGKPYHGQETRQFRIQYDYVAKLSERYPGGEIMCKPWVGTLTAYRTESGWIISNDGNELYNLNQLLATDRRQLDKAYAANHIGSVRELSTRIDTLSIAANRCPLPPKGKQK